MTFWGERDERRPMPMSSTPHKQELERIREEYTRRDREIPEEFYSLRYPWNLFRYAQRIRAVVQALEQSGLFPLEGKKILEVGFGKGNWLLDFEAWGANQEHLHGVELDERRAAEAELRLPLADLRTGDASNLPWSDHMFDVVLQATVFSSVLDISLKQAMAKEMVRVLKPDGIILWYDVHCNNPANPNVRGIDGREIKELFSPCAVKLKRTTLAPPISRWLAPRSWLICYLLEQPGIFNTHYLGVIRKSHGR